MNKEIQIDKVVVVPQEEMKTLCERCLKACTVQVLTKREIEDNQADDYYFVSAAQYKLLLKAVESFLTGGTKL